MPQGGTNVHTPITFDDGVKWLARIRQNVTWLPAEEVKAEAMTAEIETLRALNEVGALVPGVFVP